MDGETFHYKVYSFMFMLITHNGLILRPEYVCVFDQAGAQNGCTTGYVSLGKGWGGGVVMGRDKVGVNKVNTQPS